MRNRGTTYSGKTLIAYLIPLLIIAGISTFFAIATLISSERLDRANFVARITSLTEAARLEMEVDIISAYKSAQNISRNESLVRWFSGEDDSLLKELALSELESRMFEDGSEITFAARLDTHEAYYGSGMTDRLSVYDPDDSWFFDTIAMEDPVAINVDYNRELGRTMLWVNARIDSDSGVIGAAGIGLNIDDIHNMLGRLAPGPNGMILFADESDRIRLAFPTEMYNKELESILTERSMVYVDLSRMSSSDFSKRDYIYTVSDIPYLNLKMIIVAKVEDFLEAPVSRDRLFSLFSFGLILLLAFVFFAIIQKLKSTIMQQDRSQDITIHSMSMLAELKDHETGEHIIRTKKYCRILAEELRKLPQYKKYLTKAYIQDLERSAPLHDIGKVGIPDRILLKQAKLTPEEFNIIKTHTLLGAQVLRDAMAKLEFESYFKIGIQLVRHHHEKWDGSGYPDGLEGEEIPLSARIMAVADVYDALRSPRPYKEGFTHKKTVRIIIEGSGTHFQPELVEVFKKNEKMFDQISRVYTDDGK